MQTLYSSLYLTGIITERLRFYWKFLHRLWVGKSAAVWQGSGIEVLLISIGGVWLVLQVVIVLERRYPYANKVVPIQRGLVASRYLVAAGVVTLGSYILGLIVTTPWALAGVCASLVLVLAAFLLLALPPSGVVSPLAKPDSVDGPSSTADDSG